MFLEPVYKKEILSLLHSDLGLNLDLLNKIYTHFQSPGDMHNILEEKYKYVNIDTLNQEFKKVALGKCSYGIDLPVWFSDRNENKKKIFLLATDPMRGINDKEVADLNSPFSIHASSNNNYYSAIKKLSNKYDIYITDIYKLFYREKTNKRQVSSLSSKFTSLDIHARLINREIAIFKPDLILCLGKHPLHGLYNLGKWELPPKSTIGKLVQYNYITNNREIPTFAIPHASSIAAKWAQTFLKNNNWQKPYNGKTYIIDAVEIIFSTLKQVF